MKLAILDTGLWATPTKRAKWLEDDRVVYKSWVNQENVSDWEDKVGHGTHSASWLLKLAPDAKIHVARVFEEQEPKEHEIWYIAEVSPSCLPYRSRLIERERRSITLSVNGKLISLLCHSGSKQPKVAKRVDRR